MRKIIPFQKQLIFKTNVSEITSIALEHTLHNNNQIIEGELIISGAYKITETSIKVDEFEFKIPINIEIDNKYTTDNMIIDINDFYYEIINNNILQVNIEILLDNIEEQKEQKEQEAQEIKKEEEIMSEKEEQTIKKEMPTVQEERCIEEEPEIEKQETKQEKEEKSIFDDFSNDTDLYSTYYIYIVREGDDIETIMSKYNITREILNEYNDLNELKLGDKLIIPEQNVRN